MKSVDAANDSKKAQGTRWAFMKPRVIGDVEDPYLKRLYILVTPIFSIMLHRIYRPDEQRDLHDHPWNFLSILLWGWYTEQVEGGDMKRRRWFSFKKATDRHAIAVCTRKPVWSLVFTGRRQRVWGFWVDGGTRFVPFDKYERLNDA